MTELPRKYNQADENNRKLSAYRPLPPETQKSLREYYRVGLTYTSNALEGNSLTESETKVVIEDGMMSDGDDTVNDTVNDTVKRVDTPRLSKTEQVVLAAIGTHPDYSYEQLAAVCGVSRPTIARAIRNLQGCNCIRRIGSDKKGLWEIINESRIS